MPTPIIVAIPARAREALQLASRERAEAIKTEQDLLAGILLTASDVDLARVARWELTPDGIALTLATPEPVP